MTQLNTDVASIILEYADYFEQAKLFDILFPGSRQQCYKRNLKKIRDRYGVMYILFGKIHRENGLPASLYKNGSKEWWINSKHHRGMNLPAVIHINGAYGIKEWWTHGQFINRIIDNQI
jgi:hypothetical protein